MPNTTGKKTIQKKPVSDVVKKGDNAELEKEYTSAKMEAAKEATQDIAPAVDPNERVVVRSCVDGELVYIAAVGDVGYTVRWGEYGAENVMTVKHLQDMRNTQRGFFERNWITIEGDRAPVIRDYLHIEQYYTQINTFDDVDSKFVEFNKNPDAIEPFIENLNSGLKEVFARRAYALIQDGRLSNYKSIKALENALGYDFNE